MLYSQKILKICSLKALVGAMYLEIVLVETFSKCCEQLILKNIDVKIEELYN